MSEVILNTSIEYSSLPLDASQYIYEALMYHNREQDYAAGRDDDRMTRKYNLLFLIAMKNVFNVRSVSAFRKKFTPTDVSDGYGPLPTDFLSVYQGYYDLKIKTVNDKTQLYGKADEEIEYISIPNAIGALPHLCQEAVKKRFLLECKGIDPAFEAKIPLLMQDYNDAMSAWIAQADQFNTACIKKGVFLRAPLLG